MVIITMFGFSLRNCSPSNNNKSKVKVSDLGIWTFLMDPRFQFPRVLPDANYKVFSITLEKYFFNTST